MNSVVKGVTIMKRNVLLGCLCLLLAGALSCSRCQGKKGTSSLTGLIPGDIAAVMILPDLSASAKHLDSLLTKFSVGPLATFISQGKLELKRRLGFDVFDAKGWQAIGLDPGQGIAIGLAPESSLVVVGVADAKVFEAEIQKRMRRMAAADQPSTKKIGDLTVTTLSAKVGERSVARLHYAIAGKFALLCGPTGSPELLAACAGQDKAKSLAGAEWYSRLSGKVERSADFQLFANGPAISKVLAQKKPELAAAMGQGAAITFSLGPNGLSFDCFLGLVKTSAEKLMALTGSIKDSHLERRLPKETILAFKVRADVNKALEMIFAAKPALRDDYQKGLELATRMLKVEVRKATIENMTGNAVLGISVSGADEINKLIASKTRSGGDINAAFQTFFWVELKDGAGYKSLIDEVITKAEERFPGKRTKEGPLDVITLPTEKGVEVHLLYSGNLAGMCLGLGCPKVAANMITGQGGNLSTGLSADSKKLFGQPSLLACAFDFGRVTDLLSKLDAAVLGKSGMMVKMVLDMVLSAVKSLDLLTAVVLPVPDGVLFQAHLKIK
jgi:hypothetical protein